MRTVTIACTLMTGAAASAQNITIADLAPDNAFLIVGVDDATRTIERFKKTGGYAFLNDPEVRQWFSELIEEPMEDLQEFLDTIDADAEDFSGPSGMLGMALWLNEPAEGATGNDAMPFHFLISAEFGDEAANMHDMIVRAIETGEDEDSLTYIVDRIGEAEVYTVKPSMEDMGGDDWDDEWGDDEWGDDDWGGGMNTGPEEFYYAFAGEALLVGSSMPDLENALARIDGVDFDNAAGTASFARLKPQGGAYHAYAVLLNGPLYDMADKQDQVNQGQQGMGGMGMPPVMTILDALGLSEVRGVSVSMTFDADKGDTVGEFFVAAPRLRGLMSLVNVPDRPFTAPAFASPDAASISMFQLDLAAFLPTLSQSVNSMPAEFAQQGQMFIQMAQGQVQPILSQLGPEVYVVQSYIRPFSVDSQQSLFAIKAKDTQALTGAIANIAAMGGFEGRDFLGNQIWSMPGGAGMGGMMPGLNDLAIGVGFGFMFLGPNPAVENAMRQAQRGDSAWDDNERFQNALKSIDNNGLSFSYTNTQEAIAYQSWVSQNFDKIVDAQIEQMFGGMDDEQFKQQMRESMLASNPFADMPDLGKLNDYMGDMVAEFQLVNGGIRGTYIMLRPADD